MKKIKVLLDKEDREKFKGWQFYLAGRDRDYVYASKKISVHRVIMNAKKGQIVDHINGNKLDNRKSNLRFVTRSQNQWNRKKSTLNRTGYMGVGIRKDRYKHGIRYRAKIGVNGKEKWLGLFNTPQEAAKAYLEAKRIYHVI